MEIADEHSPLAASGSAGLRASERLVRRYQAEMLRAAYLLSGDAREARSQAQLAFLRFFERALNGKEITDQREQLADELAAIYLESRRNGYRPPSPPRPALAEPEPTRFAVDDQRSRVMDALDRLQPAVRAALVLCEFNALPEETVCRTLDLSLYDLRAGLEPARARLRDAAGAAPDHPVQPLLTQAAIGEPVVDIWPELEDALQRLHARQAARRRRLIAGASLATALLLILGTVWVFGLNPFSPDDAVSQELVPIATRAIAARTSPPAPTPIPSPTPELTMPDNPVGDVPDRLIMTLEVIESEAGPAETGRKTRQTLFNPDTGDLQVLDISEGQIYPSPDGSRLVILDYLESAEEVEEHQNLLSVMDARTGVLAWSREFPAFGNWTMAGDTIYAVVGFEGPKLVAIDIATGELLVERASLHRDMDIPAWVQPRSGFRVAANPDGSQLLVVVNHDSPEPETYYQTLATYALPDLTLERTVSWTYGIGAGGIADDGFYIFDPTITPDGAALYAVGDDRIQFLTIGEPEPLTVEIPFNPADEESGPIDSRWLKSNDGRYLYMLALSRMEVAVVDLLTQSVDLVAPLDHGAFSLLPDTDNTAFENAVANWGAIMSQDGRHMYLLGGWEDPRHPVVENESAIWIIDVETWRVTDRLVVPGVPGQAMWTHGGDRLIIQSRFSRSMNSIPGFDGFTVFEASTGEVVPGPQASDFPDWVDTIYWMSSLEQLHRDTYGRPPAIDGVQPETVETASTLPRLELTPSTTLAPSGGDVELDLRILDPATGQPLDRRSPGVRFDPASNPMLVLRQRGSGAETILVPSRAGPGRYSGIVPVGQEGSWNVEVRFETGKGQITRVGFFDVFQVTPSIASDSGSLYTLRVQVEPGSPLESEEWTVRASFVDVETGRVLPEGEDLETGLPDQLTATFEHEDYGFFIVSLAQAHHGAYEGKTRFQGPGSWTASVSFLTEWPRTSATTIRAGAVVVGRTDP